MVRTIQYRTIFIAAILTLIWICCFLFIKPTLEIQFGNGQDGLNANFRFVVIMLGLLVIVLYHIFDRPNPETTKLSLTTAITLTWLALIVFFPFKDLARDVNTEGFSGAVAFFTLIGGLGVCVLWIRFFADEIV